MSFKIVVHDSNSSLRMRMENRHEPALMMMRGIINDAIMPGRLTIWCWDAPGGNDKRRAIFPGYKNRPPTPSQTYLKLDLLRELLTYTPAWQVRHDGFEGDDVVAAVVNHFRGKAPIEIITRDGDLTALCGDGVTCKAKAPTSPDLIRLYKLTVGDKSDTIPGVPGYGDKAWEAADKDRLQRIVTKALEGHELQPDDAVGTGLKTSTFNWLQNNRLELDAMRRIIDPIPLTPDQFNHALTRGVDNPAAREAVLKRYML